MVTPIHHHYVFVGTSTDEKIRDLNIAAEARGIPMHFFNLKQVAGTFHNVDETGLSAAENANKKQVNIAPQKQFLRDHSQHVESFLRERGYLQKDEKFDTQRVWFAAEDSGLSVPKEIWENISKENLNPEVRDRILNQDTPAPGVETAPILSSWLGARNMYTNIVNAIDDIKKNDPTYDENKITFHEISWLNMENMAHPSLVVDSVGRTSNLFMRAEEDYRTSGRFTTYSFMRPANTVSLKSRQEGKVTAQQLGADYIAKHGPRREVLLNMVKEINKHARTSLVEDGKAIPLAGIEIEVPPRETAEDRHNIHHVQHALLRGIRHDVRDFSVGLMNGENSVLSDMLTAKMAAENFKSANVCTATDALPASNDALAKAEYILSYPERALKSNDGIILLPDEQNAAPMSLKDKLYTLMSLVVAKQLSVRDMEKPFIIINSDHSWDQAIAIHNQLANINLTKDHVIPLSPKFPDVKIESNSYFYVVNGGNRAACIDAAVGLMKEKALTYYPHKGEGSPLSEKGKKLDKEGTPKKAGKETPGATAIFCSASCENTELNKMVRDLSYGLAQNGNPVIYGAGDRYTMGAVLRGVEDYRKDAGSPAYISGYSTAPIIKSETYKGKFPESLSYAMQNKDIYERMAHMLDEADNIIVTAGGAGSLQEWMGAEILKERMPEHYKDKKLIILDKDLMPEEPNKNALGAKQFEISHAYDTILREVYKDDYYRQRLGNLYSDAPKTGTLPRKDLILVKNPEDALKAVTMSAQWQGRIHGGGGGLSPKGFGMAFG